MTDIRETLFLSIVNNRYTARIIAEHPGLLSGAEEARQVADQIGLEVHSFLREGDELYKGRIIAEFTGGPLQVARAEELVIGCMAKASGIATAAQKAVCLSKGKVRIVSGAWKKVPISQKQMVRKAILTGGAFDRISENEMLYIDKNYIRMFGSIPNALEAAKIFLNREKVVQIRGSFCSVEEEIYQAIQGGAKILMVDTGCVADLQTCIGIIKETPMYKGIRVAFAGNVHIQEVPSFVDTGVDLLCIGKEIVDAPLLDMKLDVQAIQKV